MELWVIRTGNKINLWPSTKWLLFIVETRAFLYHQKLKNTRDIMSAKPCPNQSRKASATDPIHLILAIKYFQVSATDRCIIRRNAGSMATEN